jgi:mono/diheme cytochrome c family protein
MGRALKWIAIVLGAVAALVGGFLLYVAVTGIPRYPPRTIDLNVESTPERVARGRKLVLLLCADCHKNPETRQLTGKFLTDAPPAWGFIYSKNITKHPTKGIGARTDGELAYLLRTGVRWDGQYIPPYMARLPNMADEDIASIIAFLRSDDDLVRANDADAQPVVPSFTTKLLSHVVFSPAPYPSAPIALPPVADKVAYGKYVVAALECYACHSHDFKKLSESEPEKSEGYMGGGNMLLQINGNPIYSSNLTPDDETGIGSWTAEDFRRTLRTGFRKDGSLVRYPMNRMPELTDAETDAIYAYLRTIPKIHRARPPTPPDPPVTDTSPGAQIYHRYACHSCHGETGLAYGDLRPAKLKYPTDDAMIAFLKNPTAAIPGTRMPPWDGIIKEDEYPALCAYVRKLAQ